jgi:UDP-N-acetylmuramoyl-L-alanyl-D-glutamate--2,6-diaminopimelate ligase
VKLSEIAGERIGFDPEITGLTADSRDVAPGCLFAAIPGERMDGAQFIAQAEERGAAAILARPGAASALPIVFDAAPRRRLSQMASRFYPRQPEIIAGVTGTNGKTSTVRFAAQIWSRLGWSAGSIGTLGAHGANYARKIAHTTPEPVTLHETLQEMADAGVKYLAMEVSSHGLKQNRCDGVNFSIAAFTNITQDHLDYHDNFDDYFSAKRRLFDELLPENGVVVVNMDGEGAEDVLKHSKRSGRRVITTGAHGDDIRLVGCSPQPDGMRLEVDACGNQYVADTHLIGAFQAENALLAAGIVIASGARPGAVMPRLETILGAPGRMEPVLIVGKTGKAFGVYVDYAHTPDAVATALKAIRPHAVRRVIAIIGAGGDRDKKKRPLLGRAAAENADIVIVTDDNPRSEDPAAIRRDVMKGCPLAEEIDDRGKAIATGVAMLQAGDVLLIMGKGHETGQVVGDKTLPFDDAEVALMALRDRRQELGR